MILILIISGCLCILSVLCVIAKVIPALRATILAYGKLSETTTIPQTRWARHVATMTVPKSWFAHFYLVGLTFSLYCWCELLLATRISADAITEQSTRLDKPLTLGPLLYSLQRWDSSLGSHRVDWSVCLVGLFLMTCHLTRRLLECWLIERPSPHARMHLSHYAIGLGFYGAMVFGTWLEGVGALSLWRQDHHRHQQHQQHGLPIYSTVLGLALFLYASKHQYRCHTILANLRSGKDKKKNEDEVGMKRYRIPDGDWFEFLVAPHYTCDVLVYFSLCILYQGQSIILLCGLLWSLLNLSVTASETKAWYLATFPNFPKHRWIMVPGLY